MGCAPTGRGFGDICMNISCPRIKTNVSPPQLYSRETGDKQQHYTAMIQCNGINMLLESYAGVFLKINNVNLSLLTVFPVDDVTGSNWPQ